VSALNAVAGPAAAGDLEVMTFNLRYASRRRPNSWAQRRRVLGALLRAERPHVIGTQEGLAAQLDDVRAVLGGTHDHVGVGREPGGGGEFTAIFYDTTRLSRTDSGQFWLSDTPDVVGSNTWAARTVRTATWVRLRDRLTQRELCVVNTHLDHVSEHARQRSVALIRDRLAAFEPALPIVLTGDFNTAARAGNAVYDAFVAQAGYVDAWTAAPARGVEYGTCHNYGPLEVGGPRIDWILVTPDVDVRAAAINGYRGGQQCPSDHCPVQARLRMSSGDGGPLLQ
jgi:endonuclease/exonuclease/phosphatase family metal-dependent hydrolase